MRRATMDFAEGRLDRISIGKGDLEHYLGKPLFTPEEVFSYNFV